VDVGGGLITRPRIYQAQSSTSTTPNYFTDVLPRRTSNLGQTSFIGSLDTHSSTSTSNYNSRLPPSDQHNPKPHSQFAASDLSSLPATIQHNKRTSDAVIISQRGSANGDLGRWHASSSRDPFDDSIDYDDTHDQDAITIRPTLNSNISYLSTLSRSYHTLSPFTQSVEHFMVRSSVPSEPNIVQTEKIPVKARRRRVYRLGGSTTSKSDPADVEQRSISPSPPSDCGLSDVEHYFRSPSQGQT